MGARQAHVLIVEDSELVTSAMRLLFEAADRRVSIAGTVAEALDVGTHDPADLVLLDLMLPDGDGLTIIEPLRNAGSRQFVALTGRDEDAVLLRCREAGCADVLVKPVPVRDLLSKSAAWLGE